MSTRTISCCALLAALGVVLARLVGLMPNEFSRFSIEAVPTILAGILFGPLAGALVGFTSDLVGCLFSGFGYNPIFCVPPILYGICGGLFRPLLVKKVSLGRLILTVAPAAILGSILWQSFALNLIYGKGFLVLLSGRAIQFSIMTVVYALIIKLLFQAKVFQHLKMWPPVKYHVQQ